MPNTSLPRYIKNLLILNGFDNVHAFCAIDDSDLDELESFGKQLLPTFLLENLPTLPIARRKDFFGIHWKSPETTFKIALGHRRMLKCVSKALQERTTRNNTATAGGWCLRAAASASTTSVASTMEEGAIGGRESSCDLQKASRKAAAVKSARNTSGDLVLMVNNALKRLAEKMQFDYEQVKVSTANADSPSVKCILCDKNINIQSVQHDKHKTRWVPSNMTRHIVVSRLL